MPDSIPVDTEWAGLECLLDDEPSAAAAEDEGVKVSPPDSPKTII